MTPFASSLASLGMQAPDASAANGVDSAAGFSESLRLLDLPAAWVIVLIILPIFAAVTWIGYGRESIGQGMRLVLSGLRFAAFLVLLIVLARPVLVERREEVHAPEVLVLVDDSASMRRQDAYSGDRETLEALTRLSGRAPAEMSRLELATLALEEQLFPKLSERDYEVRTYGFAESAAPASSLSALSARGNGTHLGDALTQALAANRGRHVTDIVVVSDGRSNGGLDTLEAARTAGTAGIPVHALIVGDTRPEKNAITELVEAPNAALEGDELAATVRVLGRGALSVPEVHVLLEELDADGNPVRIVAEEEIELTEDGERVVLVAPSIEADLRTGERRFRISVPPLEGETMVDDNAVEFSVHVSPAHMRVLYVDGYPRWEYRYLKNLLLRADKNLEVQCYLASATPDFPQESSPGLPALTSVPTTRAELLERYDVVILGDVNPHTLFPDLTRGDAFLNALREFVEAGGGLLFQAGEYHNPRSFAATPLEDVLPIVLDATTALAFDGDTSSEFRPLLEDTANPHEILRLHPDPDVNRRLWEDPEEGLRGFYWYSPIHKAKPGSQVLLRHPWDTSPQTGERYPLAVLGYFPTGRTMFMAVDSTWMWRYHYGDRYHETFWRNAIRWLALGRLKSGDRRFRLESSRASYNLEDRIFLEARVLDEDFRPASEGTQKIFWSGPEGQTEELELALADERPGLFRGSLQVDRPGLYRAWIESDDGRGSRQRVSVAEFEVVLPSRENADPAPDPEALQLIASKTGGRALELVAAAELAGEFPGDEERREPISSRLEDAWDRWGTLALALGLLSAEWILRKRVELV